MVSKVLFRLSRNRVAGPVVRWSFAHLTSLLPVRRVASTGTILAFHHPRPWKATHILLVPKVAIASFLSLDRRGEAIVGDILALARDLGRSIDPDEGDAMALIVNGGAYQDVAQLHFHLVSGPDVPHYACPEPSHRPLVLDVPGMAAIAAPCPLRETHLVLQSVPLTGAGTATGHLSAEQIHTLVEAVQALVRERDLERPGYSLIAGTRGGALDYSCFHLVSGPSLPGVGRGSPSQ